MPFPEKLPFTTLAVALAAAFQAAESSTSFKAACAWGVVIIAATAETILFFLKPVTWVKSAAGLLLLASVSLFVVRGIAIPAYRKEFLTEELRVNFSVLHPAQVGTDKLDLGYALLNRSLGSIVIEGIFAVQIATTDFSNNPLRNSELCMVQGLYAPGMNMMETWPHPGRKVLHSSMDRPSLPAAEKMVGYEGDLPFQDDGKLDVAIYKPKTLRDESG